MLWDRFVRLFHWSLVAGIALDYWLLEAGDPPHEWLGYAVMVLIVARIGWGFIGTTPARFRSFLVGPARVLRSLADPAGTYAKHQTHTPLGGWMMIFMLLLILGIGITGWMQDLDAFWGVEWVQELHEYSAHLLIAAACVHISAVFYIQWRYRLPLLRGMLWK